MELNYDWYGFQKTFLPKTTKQEVLADAPVFLVIDRGMIVSLYSEGGNLQEWVGAPYDDLLDTFKHRDLFIFERETVDQWLVGCRDLSHFYDQLSWIKSKALPELTTRSRLVSSKKSKSASVQRFEQKHFLLYAIEGWWKKFFPAQYGVLLQIENALTDFRFLILVRNGEVRGYHVPSFRGLPVEKQKNRNETIRYLSEKHTMPIQGIFVKQEDWDQWSQQPDPWREIKRAVRSGRANLTPQKFGLNSLLSFKAYFGF